MSKERIEDFMRKTVRRGDRGEEVKAIQRLLGLEADGVFGGMTEAAVRRYQKERGLKADGVVGLKTWGELSSVPRGGVALKKSRRTIKKIIVHCTATPEGRDCTVETIRGWHKARGWNDIGYHYVVRLDGSVHVGRDVDIPGAHCEGHNSNSIGVVYVGGCAKDGLTPKDTRTDAQKAALRGLLEGLRGLYPGAEIRSHRDFANKACPSFDATAEYKDI